MRLFLTRSIPEDGLVLIRAAAPNLAIEQWTGDTAMPRTALLARVKGVDILACLLTDRIDAEVMDAAGPSLKLIANYAVGFDNIDLQAAKDRGILVANTPATEVSEAVAEHALALMFALAHRVVEADAYTRAGKYHGWSPTLLVGTDLAGKTLGIFGGGAIGSALARRLRDGFGMRILYHDVRRNPELEQTTGATLLSKEELLRAADFVSLHIPLLPATRHFLSAPDFALMKSTAYLINTARGPVVDQHALLEALRHGTIAGAGLDVYECEPLIACNPQDLQALAALPNVVLTPHTASATQEARAAMSRELGRNVVAFLRGEVPPHAVQAA
jgi:glyoxylate reductase